MYTVNAWLWRVCLDPDLPYSHPPPKKKHHPSPQEVWRAQRAVDECKGKKQAAKDWVGVSVGCAGAGFCWGCQAPSLPFQGGWALEPDHYKWGEMGPPLEMAENKWVSLAL